MPIDFPDPPSKFKKPAASGVVVSVPLAVPPTKPRIYWINDDYAKLTGKPWACSQY